MWRDVRGAYAVDASNNLLLNPVSRANVGIGAYCSVQAGNSCWLSDLCMLPDLSLCMLPDLSHACECAQA